MNVGTAALRRLMPLAIRLLVKAPRRYRFSIARMLALAATPIPPRRAANKPALDRREHWLKTVLDEIDLAGVPYDLPLEIRDQHLLAAAVETGTGVLLVGLHEPLNFLPVRLLHEAGHPYVIVGNGERVVPGAATPAPITLASRAFMLKVRGRLKAGHIVGAMLEASATGPAVMAIDTPGGRIFFSRALFELACKCGAQIVFVSTRLSRAGRVAIKYGAPSPASVGDARMVAEDFIRFVRPRLAA